MACKVNQAALNLLWLVFCTGFCSSSKLLLIVFDGTRHDYAGHEGQISAFKYLQENGVRAKYIRPPFPTYTGPCHTTLATGLYVESHGVITNCMMNTSEPPPGCDYFPTYKTDYWWDNGGEPIWITAVKQGLKSGAHHYPGSYAKIGGRTATFRRLMTEEITNGEEDWRGHVDEFLSWFTENDLDLVVAYFTHPDNLCHTHGPWSSLIINDVLPKVNRTIFYMLDKVKSSGLSEELDIIITSDHGVTEVDTSIKDEDTISVLKHVSIEQLDYLYCMGTNGFVEPKPGELMNVYRQLKDANLKMDVYLKDEMPERWHFNHERVTSIFLLAHKGYKLYEMFPGFHNEKGQHGYDNNITDMYGIYFSIGPSFKKNLTVDGFDSIHVYSLMSYLLGLTPAPNNGSLDVLAPTLVQAVDFMTQDITPFVLTALSFMGLCFVVWQFKQVSAARSTPQSTKKSV